MTGQRVVFRHPCGCVEIVGAQLLRAQACTIHVAGGNVVDADSIARAFGAEFATDVDAYDRGPLAFLEHRTRERELAGELEAIAAGDGLAAARALGYPPLELVLVQSSLLCIREALRYCSTRVARLALERALAELEAAERDLTRNVGHGARRG
jgi:hypothetical protein